MVSVVIIKQPAGTEAERLLDELEARFVEAGLALEVVRLRTGRRFDFALIQDPHDARVMIEQSLDGLSAGWRKHLDVKH